MVRALSRRRRRLATRLPWLALPALALLLAGCGGGGVRDVYYRLQPELSVAPAARPLPGTLRVRPLAAHGFVGGSRIVYRTAQEPLRVQRYAEYLWEEVPARALADALLAALRAAEVFESVVRAGEPARADYLLTGELAVFEHRPTDDPPGVSAELSLSLVAADSRRLLVAKTYTGFEPTAQGAGGRTTPDAMVAAFNRLSGHLIGAAVADARALAAGARQ